jgi:hypothetical protein
MKEKDFKCMIVFAQWSADEFSYETNSVTERQLLHSHTESRISVYGPGTAGRRRALKMVVKTPGLSF